MFDVLTGDFLQGRTVDSYPTNLSSEASFPHAEAYGRAARRRRKIERKRIDVAGGILLIQRPQTKREVAGGCILHTLFD